MKSEFNQAPGQRWTKDHPRASWASVLVLMGQNGWVAKSHIGDWLINGRTKANPATIRGMVRVGLLVEDNWGALRREEPADG